MVGRQFISVLQGMAVLLKRVPWDLLVSDVADRPPFMLVVTTLPAPPLFHTAFVHNIVLPMLQVIGQAVGKP
jgi:hypothetical protein